MKKYSFPRDDYLKLLLGVVALSFSPLAVKLVIFDTNASAFYRSFYAGIFFLALSLLNYKTQFGVKNNKWIVPSIIAGFFLGADLVVWHKTIIYMGAGPATFLGNSQILFVTIFSALVYREKITKEFCLILAIVMVGLYMLTPIAGVAVSQPYSFFLGMIVGFTYAGMLISLRYAKALSGETYPELLSLCALFAASAFIIAVYSFGLRNDNIIVWDLKSHVIMAFTALLCQTFGWYLINHTITKIPAHEGSLTLLFQPLFATVWGAVFFSEWLTGLQMIGMILALAGITYHQTRTLSKQRAAGNNL
ncbi:MAG: DMT family transporter [Candidatus Altiarchaeia archaeon]|jgi:drug/metabolite transporter (DMT)-like permease